MEPHQQAVVDEKNELTEKADKVQAFIDSPDFPALSEEVQSKLLDQLKIMREYESILAYRISRF